MFENRKLTLLFGVFVGLVPAMSLLGSKITTLFGVSTSVAIFIVPLTFLITDVVEEVHGKKMANQFVAAGVAALLVIMAFTALFVVLPPAARYRADEAYRVVFGSSLRIMAASVVAFMLSQFHDVWAFNFWKEKTGGRALWLRNNASTIVSQAIDTLVFMVLAFWRATPQYTLPFVVGLALPYYVLKVVFALLDTPFCYLGARWLRGSQPAPPS